MATDSMKALEKAREAMQAKREAGERVERLNPVEKAGKNPKSLRLAVNAKCYDCQGRDCDPGWRSRVGECSVVTCPLHPVRPYQRGEDGHVG